MEASNKVKGTKIPYQCLLCPGLSFNSYKIKTNNPVYAHIFEVSWKHRAEVMRCEPPPCTDEEQVASLNYSDNDERTNKCDNTKQ